MTTVMKIKPWTHTPTQAWPPPTKPGKPQVPTVGPPEILNGVQVSVGGPRVSKTTLERHPYASGWNAGDIDFREDGAIFIRNPYLADAIEEFLQWNKEQRKDNSEHHLLRIVRDEGWSGSEVNVVC